ncbi:putative Ctr copper transporter [Helianthus anomalus]
MMHMTFYLSRNVTLLFSSCQTDSWISYALTLLACFIFSIFYQYMEDRCLCFKLLSTSAASNTTNGTAVDATPLLNKKIFAGSSRWNVGRVAGAVQFGINSAIGYFFMLAIMSFNGGVFVAIVVGLAVGYLLFRSGDDEQVVVVENPCACA